MLRVVVADDEERVRALLDITLGMAEGFRVVGEATSGPEAVSMAGEQHPDAVVLDCFMADGGMDAIAAIKKVSPDTKVVVFSTLTEQQAGPEAYGRGADAYLEKTQVMRCLSATIHRVCDS